MSGTFGPGNRKVSAGAVEALERVLQEFIVDSKFTYLMKRILEKAVQITAINYYKSYSWN